MLTEAQDIALRLKVAELAKLNRAAERRQHDAPMQPNVREAADQKAQDAALDLMNYIRGLIP